MPPKEDGKKAKAPTEPKRNIPGLCDRLVTNHPADEAFAKMSKMDTAIHLWNLIVNSKKKLEELIKAGGVAGLLALLEKGNTDDKYIAMGTLQVRAATPAGDAIPTAATHGVVANVYGFSMLFGGSRVPGEQPTVCCVTSVHTASFGAAAQGSAALQHATPPAQASSRSSQPISTPPPFPPRSACATTRAPWPRSWPTKKWCPRRWPC